jgi:hypothetical protein
MRRYDSKTSARPHTAPRGVDQDRENDDQVQRLLADRESGRDSGHRPHDAHAVLHLQRTAGNAAVTSLFEEPPVDALVRPGGGEAFHGWAQADTRAEAVRGLSARHLAGEAATQRSVALQRNPPETVDEDALDPETYLLPDLQVPNFVLQGPAVRRDMKAMPRLGRIARAKRKPLDGLVEMLRMAAEANGPQAAKTVAGIRSAAKRLSGGRRRSLKGAIDRYRATKPRLRSLMGEIEAARAGVIESMKILESKNLAQDRLKTGRDKDKAAEELKKWEDKRQSAIHILEGFADFATMVIDPEKGITTALDKAKGLVGNYIKDLAFGGTYAEQIKTAREKVQALTEKIRGLEDQQALTEIEAAAAGLQRAQGTLQSRFELLTALVYEAETAQLDLQKELGGMGKSGQAASEALDEGTAVMEAAEEAAQKSKSLRDSLLSVRTGARRLVDDSNRYRELLEAGRGTLSRTVGEGTPREQRAWARDVLVQNVRRAGEWTAWERREETELDMLEAFIRKGSYRTGYEIGIETSLGQVRKSI